MPKTFLRAPVAGAFLLAATALSAPASANPAIEASEAFFAWAKANGATIAEYESLTETAPGLHWTIGTAYSPPDWWRLVSWSGLKIEKTWIP